MTRNGNLDDQTDVAAHNQILQQVRDWSGVFKSEQYFIESHAMPQHEKLRQDTEGAS